ncbi:MAG: hypothetical protein FJ090_15170 [Deltaproteobacteria bacterium]|nr:hypothetical protein [Deltaproteobacteria bacterium]
MSPTLALALLGCPSLDDTGDSASGTAPDLTERLGPASVRAGVVTDPVALFGGISAEGQLGDVKIYNSRVRFIIEAVGDSGYYVDYGGNLIDADLVREPGQPGRDMIDELAPMVSLARVVDATSVDVVSDGRDGRAHVRVTGRGAPMRLATGAIGDVVPDHEVTVVTDYTLEPGAWSLEVTTTVYNDDAADFSAGIGLVTIVAQEVGENWRPGTGFDDPVEGERSMEALVGERNEGVFAVMAGSGNLEPNAFGDVLSSLAAGMSGFGSATTVAPGESTSWTARVGVAPDVATLERERLAREGVSFEEIGGTVTADGVGVPGARVHLLDATGAVLGFAVTGSDGSWTAPGYGVRSFVATGRGSGVGVDLPVGHANIGAYDRSRDGALASLGSGAVPIDFAEGFGASPVTDSADIELAPPGFLHVTVADGGPATVLVAFIGADPVAGDDRLFPGRPGGYAMTGYVLDGDASFPVEAGEYTVTVHRGSRYEVTTASVTISPAHRTEVPATLVKAYEVEGALTIDPHSHAAPSADGDISMEDRLLVSAATGTDVHFGTDHDHIVDYNPTLSAMGLGGWLKTVVADEVSPVPRGHFNAYPGKQDGRPNGGAPRWWLGVDSTDALFDWIRESIGSDGIIQSNHPLGSSGMFELADYQLASGTIGIGNKWSNNFDAMELLNDGAYTEYLPYYLDLVSRGKLVTPVGVSDSHGHRAGDPGLNFSWLYTGGTLDDFDDAVLKAAMADRATVVSRGVFLDAKIDGAWAPGRVVAPSRLLVRAQAPSWIPVDRLHLYENDTIVATVICTGDAPTWCRAEFDLAPVADAAYVVVAESTGRPITAVWPGSYAWAATSAILVDVDNDGWEAPRPPLVVE